MDRALLPLDKLKALLHCARAIYSTFNADRTTRNKLAGHAPQLGQYFLSADDFFPSVEKQTHAPAQAIAACRTRCWASSFPEGRLFARVQQFFSMSVVRLCFFIRVRVRAAFLRGSPASAASSYSSLPTRRCSTWTRRAPSCGVCATARRSTARAATTSRSSCARGFLRRRKWAGGGDGDHDDDGGRGCRSGSCRGSSRQG